MYKRQIEDCGFFESIPLWAVTLIGGLFIWVLSFVMILSVYGRFFKLYMYTAISPIPLSTFAGEPTQNVGKSFLKSYAGVCLEGAIIVLACIIFSVFASSSPVVDPNAAAASMVWSLSLIHIFVCSCSGEDFGSLSPEQLHRYTEQFKYPEKFFRVGDDIKAVPFLPERNQER